ncbi:Fasciclin-like arabinogalactan family protein [Citrus sinensis]|uniref:Fasciclin-like arabinogalactan family protein n=1 Tax=Citrus sinensis TaxID=2711 RepID=A0ACB8N7E9_CITSI|nr:Fasciclin-like arabinogalactan family protein [Citrus sinensis]
MALWFGILLPHFVVVGEAQFIYQINQTDLETAVADTRAKSYHEFVVRIHCRKLSEVVATPEHLHDFILSHLIPTVLLNNNLLHFPNGTLVPSSQPGRMLSITNSGKLGVYVNNARLVNFNVCMNSQLKSHGISSSITFDSPISSSQSMASLKRHGRVYQLEILYYL